MRTTFRHLFLMTVCAALAAGCEEQPIPDPGTDDAEQQLTVPYPQTPSDGRQFFALFEDVPAQTKVVLDSDEQLSWEQGDSVTVWDGEVYCTYTALSAGTQTILESEEDVDASKNYYAFYPADESVVFAEGSLTMNLPASQTLVQGHFPYNPAVAVSSGTDRDFRFSSICSMLGFTITREDIKEITLLGRNGETVAGEVNVDISDMTDPSWVVEEGKGAERIVLSSGDGSAIAPGTYYFAVLPQEFKDGIIFSMINIEGDKAERVRSKSLTLEKGVYLNAGNLDDIDSWGKSYHIASAEEFARFMNAGSYDATAEIGLLADIDLKDITIGSIRKFDGVFNGNGHKILNWNMSGPFIETLNGTLKGLVIDESCRWDNPPADEDVAMLVRENHGLVSGCANYADITITADDFTKPHNVAGVVAMSSGRVEDCHNHGDISLEPKTVSVATTSSDEGAMAYIGGVVGKVNTLDAPVEIVGCTNSGNVSYVATDEAAGIISSQAYIGGIAGGTMATYCSNYSDISTWGAVHNIMLQCVNNGKVTYHYGAPKYVKNGSNSVQAGGIAGYWEGDMDSSENNGEVNVTVSRGNDDPGFHLRGVRIGGLTSIISGSIRNCTNNADIIFRGTLTTPSTSIAYGSFPWNMIGGVVACAGNGAGTVISNCHNKGEMMEIDYHMIKGDNKGAAVGGVVGRSYSTITDCTNDAKLDVDNTHMYFYLGGIVASQMGYTVTGCVNNGDVDLTLGAVGANQSKFVSVGGICGQSNNHFYGVDNHGNINVANTDNPDNRKEGWNAYNVGGILGESLNALNFYGSSSDYIENGGDITVSTPAPVYVAGIEGRPKSQSSGVPKYTHNSGNINVTSGGNSHVAGIRTMSYGWTQFAVNEGDVSLTTSGIESHLAGVVSAFAATNLQSINSYGNLSYTYTGTGAPKVYAGHAAGRLYARCTLTGSFAGDIVVNGAEGGDVWAYAVAGLADTTPLSEGKVITLGDTSQPVGIAAGSVINGVEVTSENYDDRRLLLGGEVGVHYLYAPVNAIVLEPSKNR